MSVAIEIAPEFADDQWSDEQYALPTRGLAAAAPRLRLCPEPGTGRVPALLAGPWVPGAASAGARVHVRHAPRSVGAAAPLRLTRRGVAVLCLAVATLGGALCWLAARSASVEHAARPAVHQVTVQPGDTLWSIASSLAPQQDPMIEVGALQRANHLTSVDLSPGQTLRVP